MNIPKLMWNIKLSILANSIQNRNFIPMQFKLTTLKSY